MNETPFLSQTQLNTLYERVCCRFNYLSRKITSSTPLWDDPVKMCQQIEKDLFAVDTVIVDAKQYDTTFGSINTPRLYHAILCRVYILLYYRHQNDRLYEEIVYPSLSQNMGNYSDANNIGTIKKHIEEILRLEKLMKESLHEKEQANLNSQSSALTEDAAVVVAGYEKKLKERDEQLFEKEKKIEALEAQVKEAHSKAAESVDDVNSELSEINLYNKVKYEFFIRLLEHAGVDVNNTGNKTKIGLLWKELTDKSADDCRKYCSERKYNNSHTKKSIKELNNQLEELGIDIQL